jgi:hypothetical protein
VEGASCKFLGCFAWIILWPSLTAVLVTAAAMIVAIAAQLAEKASVKRLKMELAQLRSRSQGS